MYGTNNENQYMLYGFSIVDITTCQMTEFILLF